LYSNGNDFCLNYPILPIKWIQLYDTSAKVKNIFKERI